MDKGLGAHWDNSRIGEAALMHDEGTVRQSKRNLGDAGANTVGRARPRGVPAQCANAVPDKGAWAEMPFRPLHIKQRPP